RIVPHSRPHRSQGYGRGGENARGRGPAVRIGRVIPYRETGIARRHRPHGASEVHAAVRGGDEVGDGRGAAHQHGRVGEVPPFEARDGIAAVVHSIGSRVRYVVEQVRV